ncbi:uncharacterized protein LOC114730871 [Neltuma alba]|uniref:uncharacterized protein LOC114730871 n=1 Tax=Neltuma alba TaxID=207710 RepID=UPI0010A50A76|nr:uncharacterized protein LOC114730871 [Prosopis alba]
MGKGNDGFCIFPLTSLQIGDLQSYLSDISLFLANDSKMAYILVDNRPWLRDLGYQSTHLWQLMITKSRLSPFAISKARGDQRKEVCESSTTTKQNKFLSWSSLIQELTRSKKKVMLPVKNLRNSLPFCFELHRTLHGFIVFEVAWKNVCGISYLNELQTDTLMYIQAKFMQRWEFDSIAQAANCMSLWFSGKLSEQMQLKEHLDSIAGDHFYDACEDLSGTGHGDKDDKNSICNSILTAEDNSVNGLDTNIEEFSENTEPKPGIELTTSPLSGPNKRRKVINSCSDNPDEVENYCKEMQSVTNFETSSNVSEDAAKATQYKDVLISFRFNDHDLPFKLKEVIISDLRLLTLLEAGLPSWVIFLQSYPVVCNLYRPWMCPLARVLYVTISLATVLIGLYDLYKNVPILKATASHLFGPFFDWIETWDMVSRIKYLGTMLFLHNLRKAFGWCLALANAVRSFFTVLVRPLTKPLVMVFEFLLPTWNILFEVVESIFYAVWDVIDALGDMVGLLLELLFTPLWFIVTIVWSVTSSVLYPIFWISIEIVYAPIRLLVATSSFMASIFSCMVNILGATWQFVSSIFQLASTSEATASRSEVSMWRALWKDFFSQIFRALRLILNGVAEFLAACNRHRLSIYHHIQDFIRALCQKCRRSQQIHLRDGRTIWVNQNLEEEKSKVE